MIGQIVISVAQGYALENFLTTVGEVATSVWAKGTKRYYIVAFLGKKETAKTSKAS